jgi:hypothetical protein
MPPERIVVLLSRQVFGGEPDNDAHVAILHARGRTDPIPDRQTTPA